MTVGVGVIRREEAVFFFQNAVRAVFDPKDYGSRQPVSSEQPVPPAVPSLYDDVRVQKFPCAVMDTRLHTLSETE